MYLRFLIGIKRQNNLWINQNHKPQIQGANYLADGSRDKLSTLQELYKIHILSNRLLAIWTFINLCTYVPIMVLKTGCSLLSKFCYWNIIFSFHLGLRKVYPYYFTFTTFTKGRWVGEKILEVFGREFRAHPVEEYVSFRNKSF